MSWPTVRMRLVAPPVAAPNNFAPADEVWQLSLDQIESNTGEIIDKKFAAASEAGSSTICFDSGNVLYSKLRPYLNKVAIPDESGIGTAELIPLRPDRSILHPRFLAYYLRSPGFVRQASHRVSGAKMPRVMMKWFWDHSVPLPSPSEQVRIFELLDEANRLHGLCRKAEAKSSRILPALFLKAFGDPATNPMAWDMSTLGNIVTATEYGTSKRASDDGSGIPLIRMGNVDFEGNMDLGNLKYIQLPDSEVSRFRLEKGDILFNRTNSKVLVGKTGLWQADIEAVLASYFIRVRVDHEQIHPVFLWAFMNTAHMKRTLRLTARGAIGQANINSTELRAFPIYKPPLDYQERFVKRWELIRTMLLNQARGKTELDRLFSLMLDKAFSGQLTANWRGGRMQDLLSEMEWQAQMLNLPAPEVLEVAQ